MIRKKKGPEGEGSEACALSEDEIEKLLTGWNFAELLDEIEDDPYVPPFPDDGELKAAWEKHKDYILSESEPGSRPFGWYRYDSPDPRGEDESEFLFKERTRQKGENEFEYLLRIGELGEEEIEAYEMLQKARKGRMHGADNVVNIKDFKNDN